jgi:hypothetical protein
MPATKPIAPFAAGPIWSMAGLVASAQLIAAIVGSGYWFDEAYMVAIGRHHLDWGSADQPPLTPAIAALVDTLFPDSVVALRIPAIAATAACVVLILGAILTRSDVPEQIAEHTAAVYHRLPEQQRDRAAVVGESYIVAAYLDGYAERYGLPKAFSTTRSYGYFDPPRDDKDVMLFVGSDPLGGARTSGASPKSASSRATSRRGC